MRHEFPEMLTRARELFDADHTDKTDQGQQLLISKKLLPLIRLIRVIRVKSSSLGATSDQTPPVIVYVTTRLVELITPAEDVALS